MTDLVRGELVKLRSVRMPIWLLLTTLALVVLLVLVTVPASNAPGTLRLRDPDLLARTVGTGGSAGEVVMLVLGILAFTQELRFGTLTSTLLTTPNRGRMLAAKAIAVAVVGMVFAVAATMLDVVLSVVVINAHGGRLVWSGEVAAVIAAVATMPVVWGLIGVAVGALVRNQIGAVVASLVWLLVAEQLFVALLPMIGKWTPGGAGAGFVQLGRQATTHGPLLPAWAGGIVLLGYMLSIAALAMRLTMRRDVT